MFRRLLPIFSLLVLSGCGDRNITSGADSEAVWSRALEAAVPMGTPFDSAKAIMVRNGFKCNSGADSVVWLWCDKFSGGSFDIVKRRWIAILNMDHGRVFQVRSNTGLIGP